MRGALVARVGGDQESDDVEVADHYLRAAGEPSVSRPRPVLRQRTTRSRASRGLTWTVRKASRGWQSLGGRSKDGRSMWGFSSARMPTTDVDVPEEVPDDPAADQLDVVDAQDRHAAPGRQPTELVPVDRDVAGSSAASTAADTTAVIRAGSERCCARTPSRGGSSQTSVMSSTDNERPRMQDWAELKGSSCPNRRPVPWLGRRVTAAGSAAVPCRAGRRGLRLRVWHRSRCRCRTTVWGRRAGSGPDLARGLAPAGPRRRAERSRS
jgi:hypothetical protein